MCFATIAIMAMSDSLFRLMSWLSPAYPVGAYSCSHGLEYAVDAGLVTGLLGHLDLRPGREVVGLLRNLHCARLAVVLEPAALARGWTREDLLALEFLPAAPAGSPGGTEVFVYDIDLYNREREWNNARNWANPRNFSKFRW